MGDLHMVAVAQLVRVSGCGPGGRGFESHQPPHYFKNILKKSYIKYRTFFIGIIHYIFTLFLLNQKSTMHFGKELSYSSSINLFSNSIRSLASLSISLKSSLFESRPFFHVPFFCVFAMIFSTLAFLL